MTDQEYIIKLTDALVLIKDLCWDYDGFETVDGLKSLIDEVRDIAREALRSKIHETQTEDATPVIHAHWIGIEYDGYADGYPVYDVFECSNCGMEHDGEEDTLTPYCPECGAKMDERID